VTSHRHRRLLSVDGGGDDGVALVVAISLVGLVSTLMLTLLAYTMRETGASGRDRQRSSTVAAAEGALDRTLAQIQSASLTSLPCGALPVVTSQQSAADRVSVQTSVTYYGADDVEVDCAAVVAGTPLVAAKIVAAGAAEALAGQSPAERTMETLVHLTPTFRDGLDKAIFADASITAANKLVVHGQDGRPDGNVYTNGDFSCSNDQHYHGSVYAKGEITLAGPCTVDVDAHSGTSFSGSSNAVVSGRVLVASGGATLATQTTVGQQVRAGGTISWSSCTPEKCFPGVSVPAVPSQDFPVLDWSPTVRQKFQDGGGFTSVIERNDCTEDADGQNAATRWLLESAATLPGPTVLRTTCELRLQKDVKNLRLGANLAVFADGGITMANSMTLLSTDPGQLRDLYLIQPYAASCSPGGITLDNRVTIDGSVRVLLYTPCDVRKANNSDHFGQIYAGGAVNLDNSLTMFYRPLPVWGVESSTSSVAHYRLDVVYKRETA
jgi:hypothetical protein